MLLAHLGADPIVGLACRQSEGQAKHARGVLKHALHGVFPVLVGPSRACAATVGTVVRNLLAQTAYLPHIAQHAFRNQRLGPGIIGNTRSFPGLLSHEPLK